MISSMKNAASQSCVKPSVNYKLAFSIGICHLPLQGLTLVLLQLLTFHTP